MYRLGAPLVARRRFPLSRTGRMTATILITGLRPFPGAPFNPSEPLALELARRRHPAFASVRRVAHVFPVTYDAIDRELPALIAREKPAALVMFGLAERTKHVRIETRARNVLTRVIPDAGGHVPVAATIAAGGPITLPLRAPAQRLLMAALASGGPCALSHSRGPPRRCAAAGSIYSRPRTAPGPSQATWPGVDVRCPHAGRRGHRANRTRRR